MNRIHRNSLTTAATALAALLVSAPAFAQEQPKPMPRAEQKAQAPQATTIDGELTKVDVNAKQLVVKTASGTEETIRYTETTMVTGGQSGVAGLANARGTQVSVKVTGTGADRVASEITIHEKQ